MRHYTAILFTTLIITACFQSQAWANKIAPLKWLESQVETSVALDMRMDKNKLSFKGCKQSVYSLSLSHTLNNNWQFEAIAHYRRGTLYYGALSQTVKTQAIELVAWRAFNDLRVGVMHKAQPRHRIALPVGDELDLPTSETMGLYVDMQVDSIVEQAVRVSLLQQTWDAQRASMPLGWHRNKESQVQLSYSLAF